MTETINGITVQRWTRYGIVSVYAHSEDRAALEIVKEQLELDGFTMQMGWCEKGPVGFYYIIGERPLRHD